MKNKLPGDPIGFGIKWTWCGVGLVSVVLSALKLIGVLDWSWWLVLSPLLAWLAILGTGCVLIFFVLGLMLAWEH